MTLDVHKIVRCFQKRYLIGSAVTVGKWIHKERERERERERESNIHAYTVFQKKITKDQMLLYMNIFLIYLKNSTGTDNTEVSTHITRSRSNIMVTVDLLHTNCYMYLDISSLHHFSLTRPDSVQSRK